MTQRIMAGAEMQHLADEALRYYEIVWWTLVVYTPLFVAVCVMCFAVLWRRSRWRR